MFERDEQEISRIIAEGLEAIQSGEKTLEEVLAENPEQAAAIRPELEAAGWLISQQAEVSTRPGFVAASRKRVVERIQQEASGQNAKHSFFGMIWPQRLAYRWVAAILVVVVLLSSTGGLVSASQSAMPGDGLYLVKRISEEITYTITLNTTQRIQLSIQYAKRRMQEAAALIAKKNYTAVLPVLQDFQQQVNQAVTLLKEAAGSGTTPPGELKEQKSMAVALQQDLTQSADTLEVMEAEMLPPDVANSVQATQQFAQSSLETTEALISEMNTGLGLPKDTPTPTLAPDNTLAPVPPEEAVEPSETPAPPDTTTPDATGATVTGEPGDVFDPPILATPTPTSKSGQVKPGNSSHLTPAPGQLKKEDKPPKDKDPKPPKPDEVPPGQVKKTENPVAQPKN